MYAQIVLFDGFDPLDVIAPFEVLTAGSDAVGGDLVVDLVSAQGPRPVVSGTRGLVLHATARLDPAKPGYLVVPGVSGPTVGDPDEGVETVNSIVGIWDLRLRTPIGSLAVVYTFTDSTGAVTGTAESNSETVPLTDIVCVRTADGERVTWRQAVTRPMRLHLEFDVTVVGATLTGHSRAGRLPRSGVTGVRRNA